MGFVQIFFQAFIVGLSGAMAPGPLLTYNIQLSYKNGFWMGPRLVLGHAILEALLIIGIIGGLGSFIQLPITKIVLWLVGGLLLSFMGYELIWRETKRNLAATMEVAAVGETVTITNVTNMNPVWAGVVISLSNPFWAIWWATIGLGFLTKSLTFGVVGVLAFYSGHILADLGWYSFVSVAIAKGRQYLSEGIYHWLLRICGVFLFVIAVSFILDAFKTLGLIQWIFERVTDLFGHLRLTV